MLSDTCVLVLDGKNSCRYGSGELQNKRETKVETRERKRDRLEREFQCELEIQISTKPPCLMYLTLSIFLFLLILCDPTTFGHRPLSSSSSSSPSNLISNGVHYRDSYLALNRLFVKSLACDQMSSCQAPPF